MPRKTYTDRFEALLAKDYLSSGDRQFAESLYSYYKSKRSLTPGRRTHFIRMEERYIVRPTPTGSPAEILTLKLLEKRIQSTDPGAKSWASGFVESILQQLASGRTLSARQKTQLDKIKDQFNDEKMAARKEWLKNWDADKAERWDIALKYYATGTYFRRQVERHTADPTVVPTWNDYQRIVENKYATKILKGWYDAPKFPPGTLVALSSGSTRGQRDSCPFDLATVISTNVSIPTSPARGNKTYKLLPLGSAKPFLCEERQIKRAPKTKK
jgi:hypothetical protein